MLKLAKSSFFVLSIFSLTFFSFSCSSKIDKDYVELQIPPELEDRPDAVAFLKKDAKQLNKMFNSLDEFATEFEEMAALMASVDNSDEAAMEAIRPEVEDKVEDVSKSFARFNFNLLWYMGKDVFADKDATQGIIERLDTEEGIAFKKSADHIRLRKDLLQARVDTFMNRMEALDIDNLGESED